MHLKADNAIAAISELVAAGYSSDFRIREGRLLNVTSGKAPDPASVTIDAKLRFETAPDADDASTIYALSLDGGAEKGFLVDALDLDAEEATEALLLRLGSVETRTTFEGNADSDVRYGVRKVRKSEFNADPDRYVLRIGYPDFPECPFGQGFTMLGYDTARQDYVWLVTKILRDDRLRRVPYQGEASDG